MAILALFNKPMNVLSQFTDKLDRPNLKNYISLKSIYPAGRLDFDSEGLLVLTDHGKLQALLSQPNHAQPKTYWVQVEGDISADAIKYLATGVRLKDGLTKAAQVKRIPEPNVQQRSPPVRFRRNIPTSWISLTIKEGKNRQVRRMTAATGFPTLRLIRYSIGKWNLDNLAPGQWKLYELCENELITLLHPAFKDAKLAGHKHKKVRAKPRPAHKTLN